MKKYDSYKDSGVEWIGEIPRHWEITKIKNIASIFGRIGFRGYTVEDIVEKGNGAISLSPSNLIEQKLDLSKGTYISWDKYHESPEIQIDNGDVILVKTASVGKVGYVEFLTEPATLNPQLVVFKNVKIDNKFLYYLLISPIIQTQIQSDLVGGVVPTLSQLIIKNYYIPQNTLEEQTTIANFLDQKTTQIDDLIAKKERLIQLLEEERTAIINQAVTKGLDPTVPMKDSGIEWLGEIPAHWEVKRIKHTTYVKGRIGWKGLRSDEFLEFSDSYVVTGTDFYNGRIKWETCYQVPIDRYEDDPFIKLQNDDLLITKDGTIGKIAIVKDMPKIATLNSGVFLPRPLVNEYYQEFMYWILYSEVFKTFYDFNKSGSTIQHLYQNVFNEFKYPLPPMKEQTEIINHINIKTKELDLVISKTKQEIELLKEYKTALISEVVTGKVDVRNEISN